MTPDLAILFRDKGGKPLIYEETPAGVTVFLAWYIFAAKRSRCGYFLLPLTNEAVNDPEFPLDRWLFNRFNEPSTVAEDASHLPSYRYLK
jgi:hypothetical protein